MPQGFFEAILSSTVSLTVPIALAAYGGLISERAGVLNLGLEGMMLTGAFSGAVVSYFTGNPWLGLVAAAAGGVLMGLLHAFLCVSWRADQVLSGLAIVAFGSGLTGFMLQALFHHGGNTPSVPGLPRVSLQALSHLPVIGGLLGGQSLLTYFAYLLPLAFWFIFQRTWWGRWIWATGERPRVAESTGINVFQVRYVALAVSGLLAAAGGAYLSLAQLNLFVENMAAGRGFIGLAAVYFGRWHPVGVFLASLFFGLADALQVNLQMTYGTGLPREAFLSLPYILTVIILAGAVGHVRGPAAVGQPYEREAKR